MALKIRAMALASALAGATIFAAPAVAAPVTTPPSAALAPMTAFDFSRYDSNNETADWRRCRWNCGFGGYRGYRRNRVGAGDVLIGAAILGGVAAIVNSNNRRARDRDVVIIDRNVRDRDWRNDDRRYDDRRYDDRRYDDRRLDRQSAAPRGTGASGLDNAVSQCLDRIERDVRVDTVENVERTGAGWLVSGVLFNGSSFQCRIGNSGAIDGIDYGSGLGDVGYSSAPLRSSGSRDDAQWDDQRYTTARAAVGGSVRPDIAVQEATLQTDAQSARSMNATTSSTSGAMPAYPGGPLPGEVIPETIDGAI